jgi:hypothetical protein
MMKKMTPFGGKLQGKNDVTWGQASSIGMPHDQKVNKAEKLTSLQKLRHYYQVQNRCYIGINFMFFYGLCGLIF